MSGLASRYRPKDFNEVIGQDYIIESLRNQINSNDLKQVYLFSGSAGVGKTTVARILAGKLNAELKEIDAASNNSVDNVRKLIIDARYKPINKDYKVYIIDEVHMLSNSAFNAFLKILEEPPSYVVFILCTTEPNKIIPTVRSRCQQFNFKRVDKELIKNKLKEINPNLNQEVYDYIADISNGGVRDSITLLDTCLQYKENLNVIDVQNILGIIGNETIKELLESILKSDKKHIIDIVNEVYISGKDMKTFIFEVIDYIVREQKNSILNDEDFKYEGFYEQFYKLYNDIKYENNSKILIEGFLLCMAKK